MANRIRPGDSVEWLGDRWLVDDVSGYPEQRLNLRKTVVTDPRQRFKDQAQVKRNVPASEVDAHYPMKMAADESVEAGDLDDACWEGYEAVGLKPGQGGQMVPNCVPVKSAAWKVKASTDMTWIDELATELRRLIPVISRRHGVIMNALTSQSGVTIHYSLDDRAFSPSKYVGDADDLESEKQDKVEDAVGTLTRKAEEWMDDHFDWKSNRFWIPQTRQSVTVNDSRLGLGGELSFDFEGGR